MTESPSKTEEPTSFLSQEEGAVTVDWVVLAAAVVLLAVPIATLVGAAVDTSVSDIADQVVDATDD